LSKVCDLINLSQLYIILSRIPQLKNIEYLRKLTYLHWDRVKNEFYLTRLSH